MLADRFQEAIDMAAMRGQASDTDSYLADWRRADLLRPNDVLGTLTGAAVVLTLQFTSERQTVYNLTVEGLATYHVGPDGVVVHNSACDLIRVRSHNEGMQHALSWLEERGESLTQPNAGRFGWQKGRPNGMLSADGSAGWRLEFDARSGAHLNIWSGKEKGPHIIIEGMGENDVLAVLRQLFPGSYP